MANSTNDFSSTQWLKLSADSNFTPLPDSSQLSQNLDQEFTSLEYNTYSSTSDAASRIILVRCHLAF